MEEQGIVLSVSGGMASVGMVEGGGCEGCKAAGSCKAGSGGRVLEAVNAVGAAPGQHVAVQIDTTAFMKASIFVYMTPVVFLFAGAIIGGRYGPAIYGGMSVDTWQAVTGVLFLALSLLFIRLYDRMVKKDKGLNAVVVRILDGGTC